MRKILVVSVAFVFALTSCGKGEKNSAVKPKDIGAQVMEMLNQMGELTKPEFSAFFISSEELKEIAENKEFTIDDNQRHTMTSTTRTAMKVRYNFMHSRLKRRGKRYSMNWEKVKMTGFEYEIGNQGGTQICNGVLSFKYMNGKYSVQTTSIYDGEKYILTSVDDLRSNS